MQSCLWMCVCGWKREHIRLFLTAARKLAPSIRVMFELEKNCCITRVSQIETKSFRYRDGARAPYSRVSLVWARTLQTGERAPPPAALKKKPLVFIKKENPLHKKLHTSCEVEKEEARIRSEFGIYFGRVLLLLLLLLLPMKFTSFTSLLWRVINVKKRFSYSCVVLLLFSCAFFFSLLLLTLYLHLK